MTWPPKNLEVRCLRCGRPRDIPPSTLVSDIDPYVLCPTCEGSTERGPDAAELFEKGRRLLAEPSKKKLKLKCAVCNAPALDVSVYVPNVCHVSFCKSCLLALPGAITEAMAEYLPD